MLDAIQSLESNDNLKSVLPTLRLRVVRNLSPKRHGEILVGLMESGGEDVATAAVERFAPPCSPGPFCFDPVLHRLTRRRHADHYDFREEAISLVTERLVKALHNPLALKVLLANRREVAYPLTLMQKALLPLVGTLTQQMRRGDAATHTRQFVEALPPGGRIRMQCLPAFVEMLPDTFAMNMLLAACKCTSAQTTEIRVPDWELVEMERAKALLTEALPQCMAMLVRKAQNDDAGTKAAAKKVLVAVRDVSPELLVPYVEDIVIGDVSLFELAPMLPEDVRKEYAKTFARVAVRNKDGRIRRIAETALVITSKVVAKLFKYLTCNNTVVQDRALRLLCDKVADFALARHAEQILSAPDDHAFNLVEKLPVGVLEEQLISLVTYHVTHDSGAVRDLAAKALGKLADRTIAESTGTLAGYLQSDDEAVQARAVSLLGRVGSAALAPHVGLILSDPNRAAFQLLGKLARDELQAHDGAASTLVSLLKKGVPAAAIALDKLSSEALGHLSKLVMELWLQHLDVKLHKCARDLALKLPPDSIDERFKSELERLRGPLFLLDATDNYDRALGGSAAPESIVCDAVQMEVSLPKGVADAERPSTSANEVTCHKTRLPPSPKQQCFPSLTSLPCVHR